MLLLGSACALVLVSRCTRMQVQPYYYCFSIRPVHLLSRWLNCPNSRSSYVHVVVVVVVFFTLTDRASTVPSNICGCQFGTWSQRGTKVNRSHHGTTRYSDQQGSKSRQKVMRLYKRWHRPIISKRFIKPPLLHIESSLDRLGLLSPTDDQRSQQQIRQIHSNQF